MNMTRTELAVAVYDIHTRAEAAVMALQRAGFDMKKISIIGRDYQAGEHVVGFLDAGDRPRVFPRLGPLSGKLMSIGIPGDSVLRYEAALKADKIMLVVHGDAQQIRRAQELLKASGHSSFDNHRLHAEDPSPAHA